MDSIEAVDICPLCGGKHFSHRLYGSDMQYSIAKDQYEYVCCQRCGLVFLKERFLEEDVGSLYPEGYGPYNVKKESGLDSQDIGYYLRPDFLSSKVNELFGSVLKKVRKSKLELKLEDIFSRPEEGKALLDFGCGTDVFLNQARKNGWQTTGMDFNETSVSCVIASGHKGIHYDSEAAWSCIEDNSLDIIRLNHVIEHLYHPLDVITQLRKKLRKGGVLYMSTPNVDGVSAEKFKSFWWGLDCPRHIILYSPDTFAKLIHAANFSAIDVYHEESSKDYLRSMAFQKLEGLNFNMKDLFSLDQNRKLVKHFFPRTKWAAMFGRGDRIHVFVSK